MLMKIKLFILLIIGMICIFGSSILFANQDSIDLILSTPTPINTSTPVPTPMIQNEMAGTSNTANMERRLFSSAPREIRRLPGPGEPGVIMFDTTRPCDYFALWTARINGNGSEDRPWTWAFAKKQSRPGKVICFRGVDFSKAKVYPIGYR